MVEQRTLISAGLVVLGVVVGGYLNHFLSSRRDTRNKQREIRVRNLIEIFEAFDSSTLVAPQVEKRALEIAVSKVQLFGDEHLVGLTKEFLDAMMKTGSHNTDPLMRKLRDEIRSELGLCSLATNFVILRYDEISPPDK